MFTVIKLSPAGEEKTRYPAEMLTRLENGVVLDAFWERSRLDLGYTVFEPGDHFVEYYYTDRWFNVFAISTATGQRKGWYCNVAAPALIGEDSIEQVDLFLDVWVKPGGETLTLDEDEFAANTTLTPFQRRNARQGLQELLALIKARGGPFIDVDVH